jgi:hypothetical protein
MATDSIVSGLFTTPEQYQQQRLAQQQQLAAQMAQLTPEQQANAGMRLAGYQLGGGIGSALGAEDPMLKLQSQRRALIQQIDMSNPKSLVQGIQASTNDPELSAYLLGKYKELTGIQKEQSVITKNENWQKAEADAATKRNIVAEVEDKLSRNENVDAVTLNKAKLAFGDIIRPRVIQQADGTVLTVPATVDASMFPNIGKYVPGGVAGGVAKTASVIETPASIEAKRKDVITAESTIKSIDNSLDTLSKLQDLRKERDWTTNPWVADTMSKFPTQARTQQNLVKSQIADKVIGVIGEMKQQSKTGATGFGALNMAELDKLESTVRRLDPLDPNFDNDIKEVTTKLNANKDNIKKELTYRQEKLSTASGGKVSGMSGRNPQLQPTEESWIERAMAANPKYTRAQIIQEGIKAKKLPAGYQ